MKIDSKTLILGIGNVLKGDDAAGSILAQRLKAKINIIDAGITPENYAGKIVEFKPSYLWLIDAIDFKAKPGTWKIFKPEELFSQNLFFTHNYSLELFCDYIKKNIEVPIYILGIQPKSIKLGDKLSQEVESALLEIEKELLNIK
ncbi:MAG: hydrogenase 3 maturation endopeptidase HyCI [Candidatus Omnitrophota bacterium]